MNRQRLLDFVLERSGDDVQDGKNKSSELKA